MTFRTTLGEGLTMAASANTFSIAINYKNKTGMRVAASNININIHPLFSKQRILGVCGSILQRKLLVELTRTCS